MIQLNLLPDIKQEYLKAQQTKRLFMITALLSSGLMLSIVGLMAFFVFVVQGRHSTNLKNDIDREVANVRSDDSLPKVLTVQNQLINLPALHAEKPIVSRWFDYLTRLVPNDVSLDSMNITFETADELSGAVTLLEISGSSKNFKSVNEFADTLKKAVYGADNLNAFSIVVLDAIDKSQEQTIFTLKAAIDPAIFSTSEADIKLRVPNITSSPSVTERPIDLFNNTDPILETERQ